MRERKGEGDGAHSMHIIGHFKSRKSRILEANLKCVWGCLCAVSINNDARKSFLSALLI